MTRDDFGRTRWGETFCGDCGSVVADGYVQQHIEWHERIDALEDRLDTLTRRTT